MQKIKSNLYTFVIGILLALLLGYIFSQSFRTAISVSDIDPDVVVGLITALALLISIKQWARDKNFAYRLSVKNSFDQMGQLVIAKLYSAEARRQVCVATMMHIKRALDTGIQYRDSNNITSTDAFNSDSGQATAALDVYFPDQGEKWNEVIDILNEMGSLASTALLNYVENDYGKKTTQFLNDIDMHIVTMAKLNEKMGDKPKEIRDGVIEEINKHTLNIAKV
jgi:hypothetical protein